MSHNTKQIIPQQKQERLSLEQQNRKLKLENIRLKKQLERERKLDFLGKESAELYKAYKHELLDSYQTEKLNFIYNVDQDFRSERYEGIRFRGGNGLKKITSYMQRIKFSQFLKRKCIEKLQISVLERCGFKTQNFYKLYDQFNRKIDDFTSQLTRHTISQSLVLVKDIIQDCIQIYEETNREMLVLEYGLSKMSEDMLHMLAQVVEILRKAAGHRRNPIINNK